MIGHSRWKPVVATAALYWCAGRAALLMAIPPGYATAVWPACGLALVCVLAWGRRAALGAGLGSFLVNIALDTTSALAFVQSVALAGTIGMGVALEALLGAWLVRTRVGFPTRLEDERDILRFVTLGGPIPCLLSATIAVTTLAVAGTITWHDAAFNWWTWWIGDTIGVLIFAPLAVLAIAPQRDEASQRRRLVVTITLAVGFACVTALFARASAWESARLRGDFERRVVPIASGLEARLGEYESLVGSLASFFEASENVTRDEFRAFCQRALARFPGVLALAWTPRVGHAQREEYEALARRDGVADFTFTERAPAGTIRPAAPRAEYMPAYFLEPQQPNRIALGYDIASDPVRREALQLARERRVPTATQRIELVQDMGPGPRRYGLLLAVPVSTAGGEPQLRGYTVGVFRLHEIVGAVLSRLDHAGMSIRLVDASADAAHGLLYSNDGGEPGSGGEAHAISFGGRRWRLEVAPTAAFLALQRSWQAWFVLSGGLLFVGLLGVVLLITTGRATRVQRNLLQRIAAERDLQTLNAELESRVQARTGELTVALREREVLLQEVHHRVKNNLQVISSLINMQVRKLADAPSRDALEECQTRVQAIALIHEQLYRSRDYARVPFRDYAKDLARNVFDAAGVARGTVELELAIDDLSIPVDRAIPCGLLINELITNAVKHAFVGGRRGKVRVELTAVAEGRARLVVEDNGIGLPPETAAHAASSLGLRLVTTLAQQLDAVLAIDGTHGARFELTFALEDVHGAA